MYAQQRRSQETAEHPMICLVHISSLFGKILPIIGQGTRFRLVTYEGSMKYGAALLTLNPRPNSDLGILVPHSGSTSGLKFRPNLGMGTSVSYIWILPNQNLHFFFFFLAENQNLHIVKDMLSISNERILSRKLRLRS